MIGTLYFLSCRNELAHVDAVHRWKAFHFFQSDFQLCRCSNQLRNYSSVVVLQ